MGFEHPHYIHTKYMGKANLYEMIDLWHFDERERDQFSN
jgi:hypothetical protein